MPKYSGHSLVSFCGNTTLICLDHVGLVLSSLDHYWDHFNHASILCALLWLTFEIRLRQILRPQVAPGNRRPVFGPLVPHQIAQSSLQYMLVRTLHPGWKQVSKLPRDIIMCETVGTGGINPQPCTYNSNALTTEPPRPINGAKENAYDTDKK